MGKEMDELLTKKLPITSDSLRGHTRLLSFEARLFIPE